MNLTEINKFYEEIIHSDRNKDDKTKDLSALMTYMESKFSIPMQRKPEWEKENRKVIALYRKIAKSRDL